MNGPHLVRGQHVTQVKAQRARDLRRDMTPAERLLWERVRGSQILGLRFRRQQVIAGFIVDFYCHAAKLIIEIDGGVHSGQAEYDSARDTALASLGLHIMRFPNDAVLNHLPDVLDAMTKYCQQARA